SRRESWTVEDGIVKDGAHAIEQGVGVRAIAGEKTGFAYSDDINAAALLEAAGSARAIARAGDVTAPRAPVAGQGRALYPATCPGSWTRCWSRAATACSRPTCARWCG